MFKDWDFFGLQCERCLGSFPTGIYVVEAVVEEEAVRTGEIKFLNLEVERLTGWSREEIKDDPYWWFRNLHPADRAEVLRISQKLLAGENQISWVYRFRHKDGKYFWIKDCLRVVAREGKHLLLVGLWLDFSREKALEEELREKEAFFEMFVREAPVGLSLYEEKFIYVNPYVERILGYSLEELKEKYVWEVVHPSYREEVKNIIRERLSGKKIPRKYYEFVLITKNGEERFVRFYADTIRYKDRYVGLGVGIDVTPEKALERRLTEIAFFDSLTGLPNRALFLEKLKVLLSRAQRRKEMLVVAVLDLVRFQEINTSLGFEVGDLFLREVGERLKRSLRTSDVKSRFFADIFGIIFPELRSLHGIWTVIEKLKQIFLEPFHYDKQQFYLSANIGVAIFPKDGEESEDLLQKAEIALKRAKESGEGAVAFYSPEMEKELLEDVFLRNALIEGLQNGEFFLHYQPILDLREQKVVGVETLIRWEHPELGLIPPSKFIPIAEKTGFIYELGDYIMMQSLEEIRRLAKKDFFLAINFSARQFRDPHLTEKVKSFLKNYDFPPERFILEITETTAMENPERSKRVIGELRNFGIKVALDDFGIGYSSMHYLIEFEIDKIKIDRSFVLSLLESEKARKVIKTVVDLSHNLGARCLAEGIEGERQLQLLQEMGCDEGQGYLFAPPMDIEALESFLTR